MKVIVGNAWPYANGSLHIGRISSWIPGDVIARYHRLKGDEVIFISGSDCHGTPILNKAKEMNKTPKAVSDYFHREFKRTFSALDFSFDTFTKTDRDFHSEKVKEFILELFNNRYIYSKEVDEYYCNKCKEVVGDRSLRGICPHCGRNTTGEQCDNCSKLIDPEQLENKVCIECGSKPTLKRTEQLFFRLSDFENYIESLIGKELGWRGNAVNLTKKYVDEGLRDRMLSRDIDWGINIPIEGFKDKKVYVWIDAILSYLTSTIEYLDDKEKVEEYWNNRESQIYLIHGKENIPFHSIILPSILNGLGFKDTNFRILSSEYMNLEGKKFSSNRNWVVWVNELSSNYDKNLIRYYLLRNGAESRSSNFNWKDFIKTNNNELLGIYGNFVNRTLAFIKKYYNGKFEFSSIDRVMKENVVNLYETVGREIELGNMNSALERILEVVQLGDKYFDENKPWIILSEKPEEIRVVIGSCLYIVINLCNLLEPFMPNIAERIREIINISKPSWNPREEESIIVNDIDFLFERINFNRVKIEVNNLKNKRK